MKSTDWAVYIAGVNYTLSSLSRDVDVSTVQGTEFDLGKYDLENIDLVSFKVIYHGGPTSLLNVSFHDCIFQVDETENARKLMQAILAAKGKAISITLP